MYDELGAVPTAASDQPQAAAHPKIHGPTPLPRRSTTPGAKKAVAPSPQKPQPSEDKKLMLDILRRLNMAYDLFEIQAKFEYVEEGQRVHITVRNTATGKVIRQVPPTELLTNFRSLREGLGLVINQAI